MPIISFFMSSGRVPLEFFVYIANKHISLFFHSFFFVFLAPPSILRALVCTNCSQIEARIRIGGDELGYVENPVQESGIQQPSGFTIQSARYGNQHSGRHGIVYRWWSILVLVRASLSLSCRCRVLKDGLISIMQR
jgi:hypothetical protein